MTLLEFGRKLKEFIDFDHVTLHQNWCRKPVIFLWKGKPRYMRGGDNAGWQRILGKSIPVCFIDAKSIIGLDISEYKTEDGIIDFSRCIVEVTDGRL